MSASCLSLEYASAPAPSEPPGYPTPLQLLYQPSPLLFLQSRPAPFRFPTYTILSLGYGLFPAASSPWSWGEGTRMPWSGGEGTRILWSRRERTRPHPGPSTLGSTLEESFTTQPPEPQPPTQNKGLRHWHIPGIAPLPPSQSYGNQEWGENGIL